MGNGETLGTRSLADVLRTQAYCQSKAQSGFVAEQFSDIKASELDVLTKTVDTATAAKQTSRYKLELSDVYCLRRDLRYAMRSRKFLFAKAQQTRLNVGFVGWRAFGMENLDHQKYLSSLAEKSASELVTLPFDQVMKGG